MRTAMAGLVLAATLLSGCGRSPATAGPRSSGRFAGIGVFDAGRLWSQMTVPGGQDDPASAKIGDDEHIIVVLDSHTGEVRQCGDHSGYCVTMNPWNGAQTAVPVKLSKHAVDLVAEEQAEDNRSAAK